MHKQNITILFIQQQKRFEIEEETSSDDETY